MAGPSDGSINTPSRRLSPSEQGKGISATSRRTEVRRGGGLIVPGRFMALRHQAAWLSPTPLVRTLLPSLVADIIWPEQRATWKLHPTSYLDGLRGIASVIVFVCHYTEENHKYLVPSYGLNPEGQASSWLQLPFLRIVYSGRPMVHVFFVISGFVLSHKPLRAIRSRDPEGCHAALASSAFRRPLRLYGPCAVSTLLVALLIQLGALYRPLPTLSAQLWAWKGALFHSVTWPWAWDADLRPGYDVHLWTIPIEFAHSMLLFLVILVLSRVRLRVRQAGVLLLMVYSLCCGKWAAFEFLGGMFLAEVRVRQQQSAGKGEWWLHHNHHHDQQQHQQQHAPRRLTLLPLLRSVLNVAIFVAFVFVGGWPNLDADRTPGIRYLLRRTPSPFAEMDPSAPQKFWFALSAFSVVWACGECAWVRRLLESGPSQYCGRLSYAIYIVHGPVLEMLQARVLGEAYSATRGSPGEQTYSPAVTASGVKGMIGVEGPAQRVSSWFVGLVILGLLVVWAADVFWRLVDVPIITGARKLEALCLDSTVESSQQNREEQPYGHIPMLSVLPC